MIHYGLVTYRHAARIRAGLLIGASIHDIAELLGQDSFATIEGLLADWARTEPLLAQGAQSAPGVGLPLDQVEILAPLQRPGAIFCAGANYQDHVNNMSREQGRPIGPSPRQMGLPPFHFLKAATTVIGPGATIFGDSPKLDYEGELAAVIGTAARNVPVGEALDHVAGYTIANDMSARDQLMRGAMPEGSPFRYDWTAHKNFDGACPMGPMLVPRRFIPDPQRLTLRTWVNGELRQDSTTANMIYPTAELIAHLSTLMTLRPGDVVMTGTPAGVAAETGRFLKAGDSIEIEIEGLGSLVNRVGHTVAQEQTHAAFEK